MSDRSGSTLGETRMADPDWVARRQADTAHRRETKDRYKVLNGTILCSRSGGGNAGLIGLPAKPQFRVTTSVPVLTPSNDVTRNRYVAVAGATHLKPAKYPL